MKKLSQDELARSAQAALWAKHLQQQFRDRQAYWNARSMSRLGHNFSGQKTIALILDSMDRSKWAIPRSSVLSSKSMHGLARPVMDCTGCIVHGSFAMVAFCEPHIQKGGDWTVELLSIVFSRLTEIGLDLRSCDVWIQGDNASKELKSNSVLRVLSLMVARRRLGSAKMCFCLSGHNHEDIDQFFSLLGTFLQSRSELHTPAEFTQAIHEYVGNPSVRPREATKDVMKIDQVRSWPTVFGIWLVFLLSQIQHPRGRVIYGVSTFPLVHD